MDNSSITLITSVVQALARITSPIPWDHTHIPILPSGLIDILDAPTPFLVGLRARDLTEKEEQFRDYIESLDCLDTKCVIKISN